MGAGVEHAAMLAKAADLREGVAHSFMVRSLAAPHIQEHPMQPNGDAKAIINNHVLWATGAGALPVPVIDIAAVASVQLDMLKKLAALYAVDFSEERGRAWLSILSTNVAARVAANALKLVPGVGSILGGGAMAIMSGASTYALGTVVARHFEKNGSFEDLDLKAAKTEFDAAYAEGKEVATKLRAQAEEDDRGDDLDRLERLAKLHASGALTDEEFAAAKAKVLGE
jgi:uncharacterized protein (DUF697 family)